MDLSEYRINSASEVYPIYEKDPERFMRFYNAVYLLLHSLPEGGTLSIADHCKPSSYGLFVKCACLCIMEEHLYIDTGAVLEFSDDFAEIHRCTRFIKHDIRPHFNRLLKK